MSYQRSNLIGGGPAAVQPASVSRTDIFGNTYLNFCADYKPHDVDCNYVITTTFECVDYELVEWEHRDVDNVPRTLSPYVKSPLFPSPFVSIDDVLVLALEQDLDSVFITLSGDDLVLGTNTLVKAEVLERL